VQEYRGDLGIALTDVVGMDAFLADFDLYFAKLFDGLRHDSGDPVVWGEKALAHYERLRMDAHTKRLVFSDGLDIPPRCACTADFADRTQLGFGIGTNLTNDMGLVHAAHRDEAHPLQRPAGGQAVRQPGQDAVRRPDLPGLLEASVPSAGRSPGLTGRRRWQRARARVISRPHQEPTSTHR
jgi:hypothetical protein